MPNSKLPAELLRAIRGKKLTASALSRKLNYGFNQVSRWEKGERKFLWTDFVAVCQLRKLPLEAQITTYTGFRGDLLDFGALTKTLMAGKSIDEVSKATSLDRSKISRWLHSKASPSFLDIYTLLELTVSTLSFLEPLVHLPEIPCLAADYAIFSQQRELSYDLPYLDTILEALLLREYRELKTHCSRTLGRLAGLPASLVESALTKLAGAGMVGKEGGKYRPIELGIDYRSDRRRMVGVITHWQRETTRTTERLSERSLESSLVAFGVLSLSQQNHDRAQALFREFNMAIHALGAEEQGEKEKVLVLTAALMDAARFGEA